MKHIIPFLCAALAGTSAFAQQGLAEPISKDSEDRAVKVADRAGDRLDPARTAELRAHHALGAGDAALTERLEQPEILTAERRAVRTGHAGVEAGRDRAENLALLAEPEQRESRPIRLDDERRGVEHQETVAERLEHRFELGGLPPHELISLARLDDRAVPMTLSRCRHNRSVGGIERGHYTDVSRLVQVRLPGSSCRFTQSPACCDTPRGRAVGQTADDGSGDRGTRRRAPARRNVTHPRSIPATPITRGRVEYWNTMGPG